jgi:glutamate/tyrosine decarboxylase-like PLP-dependent enzyme
LRIVAARFRWRRRNDSYRSPFLEEITAGLLRSILRFPASCGVGFVTGATMANFSCLAAARHALLTCAGWNVEEQGLFGAPEIRVVVGNEVDASLLRALSLVGLGRKRVTTVPVDEQGRMTADALPPLNDRTLVCIQAGNVNTGPLIPRRKFVLAPVPAALGCTSTALSDCGLRQRQDELKC